MPSEQSTRKYPRAFVKRGRDVGIALVPHLHKDGIYVVSRSRFEKDYIRVPSLAEAVRRVKEDGLHIRMSPLSRALKRAPALISPESLDWVDV